MLRLRSCASSMIRVSYWRSSPSVWTSASRMPSVISLTRVFGPTWSVNLTFQPTASPSGLSSSSATRSATVRAAIRRGWVWPIRPRTPRPSSRQILGIWVVLPEPVSPATITTWWSRTAARISSFFWLTGSSAGYRITGTAFRRRSTSSSALSMSEAISAAICARASSLRTRRAPSSRRPIRTWSRRVSSGRRAASSPMPGASLRAGSAADWTAGELTAGIPLGSQGGAAERTSVFERLQCHRGRPSAANGGPARRGNRPDRVGRGG